MTADTGWPDPALRALVAGRRAAELRERRLALARGDRVTGATLVTARARAHEAAGRAEQAERAALYRHVAAHQAHMQAAAVSEQAALKADDVRCEVLQAAAERHRGAAGFHQQEAAMLMAALRVSADFFDQ